MGGAAGDTERSSLSGKVIRAVMWKWRTGRHYGGIGRAHLTMAWLSRLVPVQWATRKRHLGHPHILTGTTSCLQAPYPEDPRTLSGSSECLKSLLVSCWGLSGVEEAPGRLRGGGGNVGGQGGHCAGLRASRASQGHPCGWKGYTGLGEEGRWVGCSE